MKDKRVLVSEKVDDKCMEMLEKEFTVDLKDNIGREELLEIIENYHGLLIRSNTKVNKELLDRAKNLVIVGRAGNGVDNVDIPEATKHGVLVANTPDSNTISACELTIGHLLAQSRYITKADRLLKEGGWDRKPFEGSELYNKTLGIIGLGRIGSLVATRMKAFGMNIISYDPYISDERFERYSVTKKETLDELLAESDFITIHTPRTQETRGMIGKKEIAKMKDGVRIANVARGGIIVEADLLEGLKTGKITSAGLDVFEQEPCYNNPLFEMDNITVTPHIGATTVEAQQDVGITIAKQIINGIKGEIVPNAINLPSINREDLEKVAPYISLMENLGKIYYQLYNKPASLVNINYYGKIAEQDTNMITLAIIKGLLEPVIKENVNYVNAKFIAEERGIVIHENNYKQNYKGYRDLISIKIDNGDNFFSVSGSLSSKGEGKIVNILDYEVDINPSEHMLIVQNKDVPGVIGEIGSILGEENINIATMQVGRDEDKEEAIMVLNVDDVVSERAKERIMEMDNIIGAKSINL